MEVLNNKARFIQENSPDGGFLQSDKWRMFQESVGRKTFNISGEGFWANIIEHKLPVAGKYFYVPRGPIISQKSKIKNQNDNEKLKNYFKEIIKLAKENKNGWIRIEPENISDINRYKDINGNKLRIVKAPHDMQPREILVIDITKSEDELLVEMKAKTRYNVRLAEKKGVKVLCIKYHVSSIKYFDDFIRLVKVTAERDGITLHPENYYRKMFEVIPNDILKLYIAEYQGKIITANIMVFYGNTATYLHGASDYNYRNTMAPYLLQWRAIQDAKKAGCIKYDLGGIKLTNNLQLTTNNWQGITRFKTGFAPDTKLIIFPGSYDIIVNSFRYNTYRILQKIKSTF